MKFRNPAYILHVALILVAFVSVAQTPVTQYPCDPRSTANNNTCPADCVFPANVEAGCNCFDNIDNDGDGNADAADPKCAAYFGLTFVGRGSDCSIVPPGANTPFDLVGPPVVSGQNTADTQSKVAAGDVDGNGVPDLVITSKWNSEVRVTASAASTGLAQFGGDSFAPGDIIAGFDLDADIAKNKFNNADGINPANLLFEHEILIADIFHSGQGPDGSAEIFCVVSNRQGNPSSPPNAFFLLALRLDQYGPGGLVTLYDPVYLGKNRPGTFGIADMDGDGKAEIYLRDRVFAAETGALLASEGGKLMSGTGTDRWDVDVTSAPVAVDIKSAGSDGSVMELVTGSQIYRIPNITNRNPGAPASLTLWRNMNSINFDINSDGAADQYFIKLMNDPAEYGIDTHSSTSVADIDGDGFVDVIVTGALNSSTGRTAVFYWNVQDNTVTGFMTPTSALLGIPPAQTPDYNNYLNGWIWGTGRVNIGDADGDGNLDLLFVAGNQLFCVSPDASNNLNQKWLRTINDSRSGVLTVTIYDFDNDGNPEVVYRDSQELVIIDGATGSMTLFSRTCRSHTYTEGPIIADVNGDGNTDICVACNRSDNPAQFSINAGIQQQALGELRVWFSSGEWLPTRKVWNQPGYFVVNINDDLTLPFPQFDIATRFEGDCGVGPPGERMPFNVFLNQVPFLSATGCPIFPAPDLTFIGDDPNDPNVDPNDPSYFPTVFVDPNICGNLDLRVGFNITNSGDLPISTTIPVSFYINSPYDVNNPGTLLHTTNIDIVNLQIGDTLSIGDYTNSLGQVRPGDLPFIAFDGPGTVFTMYVVLYDDGTSIPIDTLAAQNEFECDITNNFWPIQVIPKPFTVNIDSVDDVRCLPTSPPSGQLISHISIGADTVIDLSPYAFQWFESDAVTPITGATNYNLTDIAAGDYYLVITNTEKGCSSDPILGQVQPGALVIPGLTVTKLSDQTDCEPPNGALQADVTGGNAGFEFSWEDVGGPIGVTGPLLENVRAGTYTVVVTETTSGCTTGADGTILDFTREPEVEASAVDVVNCLNASSGQVTATALLDEGSGPVPQDSLEYRFDWYFYDYDPVTDTYVRGSILPGSNGNPTVKDLDIGFYEVVVTQLSTGCTEANIGPDTVQVRDSRFIPEVLFTELAPQTSCDPLQPNGRLQADAIFNGQVLNPADFTFEWFEGQNTTTPHAGGTSGTNGQIAENVKGGGQAYTVRITTSNNCSVTADTLVTEIIIYPQVALVTTPNSVCDQALGFTGSVSSSVTFDGNTITAPNADYSWRWYNGAVANPAQERVADFNQQNLAALDSGFYTLVVTNEVLHCPSLATVEQVLSIKALPVITADADSSTNCLPLVAGNGGVQVTDVDGAGVTNDYTYSWHRGIDATGQLIANTSASPDTLQGRSPNNFFTVLVRNNSTGCENTETVEVVDASVLPLVGLSPTPNDICDITLTSPPAQYTGQIVSSILNQGTNPIADYQFTWTDDEDGAQVLQATGAAGQTLLNRDSSYYTLVVVQVSTGCASDPVTTEVAPDLTLPVITADANASTNCDPALSNGGVQVIDVDGAGTGAPYVFEWRRGTTFSGYLVGSTAASPDTLQGAAGRFYTVRVINQNDGCQNTETVEVPDARVLPLPALTPSPNSICDASLTNPPVDYNGSVGSLISNQGANLLTDYQFTWTDEEDGAQVLQATGAAGQNLLNRDSSYYTLVVLQLSTGCVSNPVTAQVTADLSLPDIAADANPSTNCDPALANGGVQVTDVDGLGTGSPFVFAWHRGSTLAGALVANTAASPDTLQGGTGRFYTVQVTNQEDGCRNTETVEVPDARVLPIPALTPSPNSICDASLTNPPVPFNGSVASSITNQGASPLEDYQFTWTDEEDGTQVLQAVGAAGQNLLNRDSSYYTLIVLQLSTGCVSNPVTAEVTPDLALPVITADANASTNCDPALANGGVQVTDVDGLGTGNPFVFEWRRGVALSGALVANTAASPDTLQGGAGRFFIVQVTNQEDGCRNTRIVEVPDERELPVITLASTDNTICSGTPDGTASLNSVTYKGVTLTAPDPFTGYAFNWTSGETTPVITQKGAGFYELAVTKTDVGCTSNPVLVEIEDNLVIPVVAMAPTPQTSCDPTDLNGQIDASVDLGGGTFVTNGFTFEWFNGNNVSSPLNAANVDPVNPFTAIALPGNLFYTVRVTNNLTNCQNTNSVFLQEIIVIPRIELAATDIVDCSVPGFITATIFADLNGDGVEDAVPLTDYADYQFTWFNGNSTSSPVLASTTGRLLEFLDDLVTPIPAAYYTATVENITSHCASSDVTDLLNGPGPLFDINIEINSPLPASCAQGTGVMTAYIDDGGSGTVTGFTFEWYEGSITNGIQNPPPSFYTDPPVSFQLPALDVDAQFFFGNATYPAPAPAVPGYQPPDVVAPGPSFTGPTLYGVQSGTYTVVATRDSDGCKEYLTTFLPFQTEPIIITTEIRPDICSADIGEISVDIQVPGGSNASDYKIWLIPGVNPTLNPPSDPAPFTSVISPATATGNDFTGLGPGIYTVVAQENPAIIATGCFSSPVLVEMREALPPVLDLLGSTFNTTCGTVVGDGSLEITFDTDPSDPFNPAFPPPPPPVIYNPDPQSYDVVVLDGGGATVFSNTGFAGGTTLNIPNLVNGDFEVTVTSSQGCEITKTFTVPWNPQVSEIGNDFVKQDALYCDPALEVNASVEIVSITTTTGGSENFADYRFDWFTDLNLSTNILAAVGDPTPAKGGEVLSNVGAPLPAAPVSVGSYWVVATKLGDLSGTGGVGCFTAPLKVDILDNAEDPVFVLTPFTNTACDTNFEGSLQVTVTDPGSVAAATGYAYTWLQSPAASPIANSNPNDGDGDGSDGDGDNPTGLSDGVYRLEVRNNASGCLTTGQTTILKTAVPIIVASATTINQFICDPDGSATVVDVTVGGVIDPNHANFDFTWYQSDPNSVPIINEANDADVLDVNTFASIGAGSYYVKAKRVSGIQPGSGCESAPLRVDISDLSRDPVVSLAPFSNTSCDTNFEGSIRINVTDPGSLPAALGYAYRWLQVPPASPVADSNPNDGDGDGADGDGDNPTGLSDGVYRLEVENNSTGCVTTGQTTILKTSVPIIVASATTVNQVICNPDGSITVVDVTVDGVVDPNHANFDFTWYQSDPNSVPIINEVNNEDVLDINNFASIGAGSYFVKAKRVSGLQPGSGCESAPLRVDISDLSRDPVFALTPFSNTACDMAFEGSLQVVVSDPGSLPATLGYAYRWILTPAASPIADTDPNDGDGDGGDGDGDRPIALSDGVYRLEVANNNTGCVSEGQTTILKTSVPVIVASAATVDQIICNPDGSITVVDVTVDGVVDPNHANFDFTWYQSDPNTVPIINEVNAEDVLDVSNFASIGGGTYYVKAKRVSGVQPGSGCESAPLRVDIQDNSRDPNFTLTPFSNSACDTNFEGGIRITVSDPGSLPATLGYTYRWIQTPAASPIADSGANDGDGDGADGDNDNPTALSDGVYQLEVENNNTGCFATGQTNILKTTVPIIITSATTVDQLICAPGGSVTVTQVTVGGVADPNHANFDFTWYQSDPNSVPIINEVNGEDVLDINSFATLVAGQYFVKVKRIAGLVPGSGCESAPFGAEIKDLHVNPIPSLQPFANSSCTGAFLNGAIRITAKDNSGPGVGALYDYIYIYDDGINPPAGPVLVAGNNGNGINDGDLDSLMNLGTGVYSFSIRNQATQCVTPAQVAIVFDPVASLPNIVTVDKDFPIDCLGNGGEAIVTAIRVGSNPPITGSPQLDPPNFRYDWYDNPTDPFLNPAPPGNVAAIVPDGREVNMLVAGTYYVTVRDLLTDCKSTPTMVVIDSANIVYPQVLIQQTVLQLSCDPADGTAELQATADGFTDANATYTFTWFNSLDGTGTTVIDPWPGSQSTISDLTSGNYSVTALNSTTGCSTTKLFIIPPFDPKFFPKIATSGDPQSSCIVPNGSVVVRVIPFPVVNGVTYNPPYNFVVDLYLGDQTGAGLDQEPPPIAPDIANLPPLPFSPLPGTFIADPLDAGTYTVRLIDLNTGCIVVEATDVVDDRRRPVPLIEIENPLTNCDSRTNGQLSATADGRSVSDYDFFWWSEASPNDTITTNHKLIGQDQGRYFVSIVNKASGCDTLASEVIPVDQLLPPAPSIILEHPQTICWQPDPKGNFPINEVSYPGNPLARPNGWLSANVGGQTIGYRFEWFEGELDNQQVAGLTPDTVGINYLHLTSQFYTVKSVILETGCSNVTSLLVPEQTVIPTGIVETTPSFCEDARQPSGSVVLQQTNEQNVSLREVIWYNNESNAYQGDGIQVFELPPGFYRAEFISNEFCYGEAIGEIKTEILAYNLVSANSDNANDVWIIDCISRFTIAAGAPRDNNVKIFNRHGVLVYEADGYNNDDIVFQGIGENGIYALGDQLPDGTYFFVIDKRDGSKPITGFLELIR